MGACNKIWTNYLKKRHVIRAKEVNVHVGHCIVGNSNYSISNEKIGFLPSTDLYRFLLKHVTLQHDSLSFSLQFF